MAADHDVRATNRSGPTLTSHLAAPGHGPGPAPEDAGTQHAHDARHARPRVPGGTVLPCAAVAAYGSGFWLIATRLAVGAIERTTEPFVSWLQESTLLLPAYALVVYLALTLARRRFGPGPLSVRHTLQTVLMVAVAVTVLPAAVQAVNAVIDLRLQAGDLQVMASHGNCVAECLADRRQAAVTLQIRALGLNGIVMLVSNLTLLLLLVALRGGRLDLPAGIRASGPGD